VAGPGDAKRRPELGGAAVHRKASGAFSTMRQLGGAFGVAILVAVSGRVAVGQVSSGAWGETLGACLGLACLPPPGRRRADPGSGAGRRVPGERRRPPVTRGRPLPPALRSRLGTMLRAAIPVYAGRPGCLAETAVRAICRVLACFVIHMPPGGWPGLPPGEVGHGDFRRAAKRCW
jgi:hypothetical protein